ncbi:PAP2-domain-containing protein [Auriculariales sp. MPI-PUGE-AT-0066]|nr:PAP2-domain-containing protein [Auriculariales sp. MPI-PUGE-AT-0066]
MSDATNAGRAALELTQVYCDLALALITLSPILLQASYAALAVYTRELIFVEMWAGQLLCEAANWVIKQLVRQPRPMDSLGTGYGFPSSHSQYMGYFATFVVLHVVCAYRPPTTNGAGTMLYAIESLRGPIVAIGTTAWAVTVCYSRLHLAYHSVDQVAWGVIIGIVLGASCTVFAHCRDCFPSIASHPLAVYFRLRDSWDIWGDGGNEDAYWMWRRKWDVKLSATKVKNA